MSGALPEHIDDIEAFYKSNLENLEMPPSMDLWEKIDAALPPAQPSAVVQKPNIAFNNPAWWAGAGLGLVALAGLVYWIAKAPDQAVQNPQKKSQQIDSASIDRPSNKRHSAPELSPTHTIVEKSEESKVNKEIMEHGKDKTVVKPELPRNPNPSAAEQSIAEPTIPSPQQEQVDTAAVQQKVEAPANKEVSKKTLYEKLKEKNKNKANDLFIKKKD